MTKWKQGDEAGQSGRVIPFVRRQDRDAISLMHFPGGVAHQVASTVEAAMDDRDVVVGELLEVLPPHFRQRYKRLADIFGAPGIEMAPDPATVLSITLAVDGIEPLKVIHEPGDQAC